MGHETIGRVVEVAPGTTLTVGQRVAVNPVVACGTCPHCTRGHDNLCHDRRLYGCSVDLDGGLASHMTVIGRNCVPVDTSADLLGLVLIEPMAVGTQAVRVGQVGADDSALIVGGGPIGIAVALACLTSGASATICEPLATRRAAAQALGVTTCRPDDLPAMAGAYPLTFECVGTSQTMRAAVTSVRSGGTVVCLGLAEETLDVRAVALVVHERRLIGASAYTSRDFQDTAQWVSAKADRLAPLVELADAPEDGTKPHRSRSPRHRQTSVRALTT